MTTWLNFIFIYFLFIRNEAGSEWTTVRSMKAEPRKAATYHVPVAPSSGRLRAL